MVLLIGAFAAMWLLDEALSSVFVRRWRIYCMMLVDGFRGFVGLGCWFVCVALGRRLWRSLMVEGLLLSLLVDGGLFKLIGVDGWAVLRWRGMVYAGLIVGCW